MVDDRSKAAVDSKRYICKKLNKLRNTVDDKDKGENLSVFGPIN